MFVTLTFGAERVPLAQLGASVSLGMHRTRRPSRRSNNRVTIATVFVINVRHRRVS